MSVPELARSLAAVGFAKRSANGQEGLYILAVDDGNLVEKLYVGNDVESESIVASDVREDCSTPYLLHEDSNSRLVFLIDKSNILQLYTFNEEMLEWEQSPLFSGLAIETSPESKLAACFTPTGETAVCYQGKDGKLVGVASKTTPATEGKEDGKLEWQVIGPLKEASPKVGTPLRLEVFHNVLHLFYVQAEAGGVHYFELDPAVDKWEDKSLENSVFDDTDIVNFVITSSTDNGDRFDSYYLTTGGTVWTVAEAKGDRKNLGKVDAEGNFKASDNAQAGCAVAFGCYNSCWQPPQPCWNQCYPCGSYGVGGGYQNNNSGIIINGSGSVYGRY